MGRETISENVWETDPADPNQKTIEEWLATFTNAETHTNKWQKTRWVINFLYTNFERKYLLEYGITEYRAIKKAIDAMTVSIVEKRKYHHIFVQLINYFREPYTAEGKPYNATQWSDLFASPPKFHNKSATGPIKKHYLKPKEWVNFLLTVKAMDVFDYIKYKTFLSGCRVGGLVNIRVNAINFQYCYFDTKEKQCEGKSENVRYFFDKGFASELKWYILAKNLKNDDLLFPWHPKTIRKNLDLYSEILSPHDFRRSLERILKKAKIDIVDRNTLLNHTQNIDGIYSAEDPLNEPWVVQQIYQSFYDKEFKSLWGELEKTRMNSSR